ncbi:NUDIX domain-containing protein [Cereibacter changlensis]|uniref:NUDIX domain-containing protein n=1 Tax=Cereibacter changlensis TaxID=402884 RepID=A0A4V5NM60_9RHOB|nr:NUDIX domain-containing protein [Cereibacter changlensis]TKA98357.1 NUDIX domain-containing protein [Cereibacter changlensis]
MPDHLHPVERMRSHRPLTPLAEAETFAYRPWRASVDGPVLGHMAWSLAEALCAAGQARPDGFGLCLTDAPTDPAGLSERLEHLRHWAAAHDLIPPERGERMAIRPEPHLEIAAWADRSLMRPFGLWLQKVHINGQVRTPAGPNLWLSLRSPLARSAPGEWDTLVAGGQALGDTAEVAARREAFEEAGLNSAQCAGLLPRGVVALSYQTPLGLHREVLTLFDLDLPADYEPRCHDGEIVLFRCFDAASLETAMLALPIKFAARLIIGNWVRRQQECDPDVLQTGGDMSC